MKTISAIKTVLLSALLLVFVAACSKKDSDVSSDPKAAIVGKWHQDKSVIISTPITGVSGGKSGTETYTYKYDNWLTFNANGTYNASGKSDDGDSFTDSGTYSISGNKLTVSGDIAIWEIVTLNGSTLVIRGQDSYDENGDGVKDTNETLTSYFSK